MTAMNTITINVQHPLETLPYNFPFADFLTANSDSVASFFVEADEGVTLSNAVLKDDLSIEVDVSGGVSPEVYTVAAQIVTTGGLSERQEILIRIRGDAVTGSRITGDATTSLYISTGYYVPGYIA